MSSEFRVRGIAVGAAAQVFPGCCENSENSFNLAFGSAWDSSLTTKGRKKADRYVDLELCCMSSVCSLLHQDTPIHH